MLGFDTWKLFSYAFCVAFLRCTLAPFFKGKLSLTLSGVWHGCLVGGYFGKYIFGDIYKRHMKVPIKWLIQNLVC